LEKGTGVVAENLIGFVFKMDTFSQNFISPKRSKELKIYVFSLLL